MTVLRCLRVGIVLLSVTSAAGAQLPGLPGTSIPNPWQTGFGNFGGPYFPPGLTSNPPLGSGVFCVNQQFSLQYGYPWTAFLATSQGNATPAGYTNTWLGAACLAPSQSDPYAFSPIPGLPPGANPPVTNPQLGTVITQGSPTSPTSNPGATWQNLNWIQSPPVPPVPPTPPPPPQVPPVLEPHVTPEPATWLLLGSGVVVLFGVLAIRRSRLW